MRGDDLVESKDKGSPELSEFAAQLLELLRQSTDSFVSEKDGDAPKFRVRVLLDRIIGDHGYCLVRYPIDALAALTENQKTIARYVSEGLTNQEIADRLGKSIFTIATTLGRVYRALNVKSRQDIKRLWILFNGFRAIGRGEEIRTERRDSCSRSSPRSSGSAPEALPGSSRES